MYYLFLHVWLVAYDVKGVEQAQGRSCIYIWGTELQKVGILGARIPQFLVPPPTEHDLKRHLHTNCRLKQDN